MCHGTACTPRDDRPALKSRAVDFHSTVYEGEFWWMYIVTFGQNGPKFNSILVYSSWLYSKWNHKLSFTHGTTNNFHLSIWNFAKGINFGKTIVHTSQQGPNLATHTQQNLGLSLQVSDRVGHYIQGKIILYHLVLNKTLIKVWNSVLKFVEFIKSSFLLKSSIFF